MISTLISAQEIELIDTSGAWRLPFNGTRTISNGPLEGLHTGKSAEAIDYFLADHTRFEVFAPANGVVTDVFDPSVVDTLGFGWLVRINHNGTTSFFAHLKGNSIVVTQGQNIKQGQLIAKSGNTGNGEGNHLHFEARTAVTAGVVNSGNASPIRSIPGNWWNAWYSPPSNFQHDVNQTSGGAQYPEMANRPTTTSSGARHLSNQQSPPNVVAGWTSNISPTAATLHFGAAPNTPNTNWQTTFYAFYRLQNYPNVWYAIPGGPDVQAPSTTLSIGSYNQSLPNGQHTFMAWGFNNQVGNSTDRHWEIWPGNTTSDIPHLVATFRPETDSTTLEFCSYADKYRIYEYHGGASSVAFTGVGCTVLVHRQLGNINQYAVSARIDGIWTPISPWLVIQD
ncbi:MAG: M23 family metallopeptidase [Chloroflexi bacterium]|nr:M23 family metallopeptidase [Chloroflexota bacterium]